MKDPYIFTPVIRKNIDMGQNNFIDGIVEQKNSKNELSCYEYIHYYFYPLSRRFNLAAFFIASLATVIFTYRVFLVDSFSEDSNYSLTMDKINSSNSFNKTVLPNEQRVVLLAGPHKTASSSIQQNVMEWSRLGVLRTWKWPAPDTSSGVFVFIEGGKDKKVFAPMMNILSNRLVISRTVPRTRLGREKMLANYREEFRRAWRKGHNIVIGAEGSDCMFNERNVSPDRFVEGFLSLMPWSAGDRRVISLYKNMNETVISDIEPLHGGDQNLTVVITYRAPRVEHFLSAWHMFGNPPNLRNWTLEMDYDMHLLDPLGMAEIYLSHGISVVIIDLSGITHQGLDISSVIACDVLKVPCKNSFIMGNSYLPQIRNHMRAKRERLTAIRTDMTYEELQKIDEVMNIFDCTYRNIFYNPKIQILYGYYLLQNILSCPREENRERQLIIKTRYELRERIKMVAKNGLGFIELRYNHSTNPPAPYFVDIRYLDKKR